MSPERIERKLAAILAADVAGYSRLMGADEEGTLTALKAHRRELIDAKIVEYRGRIVKTTGDGILIEFPSVVDAVRCGVEVQKGMVYRNASIPEEKRMEFRVGINLGDIIIDGDDIHGDGVNIAARLQALAEPGGICISQTVFNHARDKVAFEVEDAGEQALKNIARAVHVYRVVVDPRQRLAKPPSPERELALPDKPSIAVLPFQNMSGDAGQEFFADGMTEDITTALSKLRWFFVIARNSAFAYKGKSTDVRQVARELGVRYVLEGSTRRAGNRLRITAQLVDALTGNHIWAEKYDREIADIFTVQDEITQSVVATIEPQLYAAENIRIQSKPPERLDAWECVIRALWHLSRITPEDTEQARQLLSRAIELSPNYAKAHSLLAWGELNAVSRGTSTMDRALPAAEHHAQTALALDDSDPWTYFAVAVVEAFQRKYADAVAAYDRAIDLNPNFAMAHGFMAGALAYDGKSDLALERIGQAMRMSPRDPFNSFYALFAVVAYFTNGRFAEAVEHAKDILRERPSLLPARRLLAACYIGLDMLDEARTAISEVLRLNPYSSVRKDAYGGHHGFARAADQEHYAAALRVAGLPEG